VREGVCIRLYSEEDFAARPPYTQPEIQRANLAEVILRMKAFRLGEIETFPFLNPPSPAAIQGGYTLLQELGALDAARNLTELGGDLARLPIDPTLGRMLMQAQQEHAARELLIIASGLSIQDPRERPHEQQAAADAAHRRFLHPESDFLSLLNLWNGVHEQWEKLPTQNQRRKFCRQNFLSYVRMREWQDLHAQLHDALQDLGSLRVNESSADYGAVHRSILAGLLAHVAVQQERNLYRGVGNRQLSLFPGSVLHSKKEAAPKSRHPRQPTPAPESSSQPEWLVAGEIVETSRLFARTVAGIDPVWVTTLAPHLCEVTHHNPRWSADAGKVIADEKTLFYGMEVRVRQVAYGNVNPKEAAGIFVRSALVEETLLPEPKPGGRERDPRGKPTTRDLLEIVDTPNEALPARYSFIEHNRTVRQKIETWRTRSRRHDLTDTHEALAQFYLARLAGVSSLDELNRYLRENPPETLFATEQDLAGDTDLSFDANAFPDKVRVGENEIAVSYAYAPGEEKDGVTLRLNPALAEHVSGSAVAWAVPGLRESLANEMLRALPKSLRKELMPLPPKAREIAAEFEPGTGSLEEGLARFIFRKYGVLIPADAWSGEALPPHLRARVELVGGDKRVLAAGRDLEMLRKSLAAAPVKAKPAEDPAWNRAVRQWEQFGLTSWGFGNVPERITITEQPEATHAWLGLQLEEQRINLRLFRAPAAARQSTLPALRRLVEMAIQKDLAWLERDLRGLKSLEPLCAGFCPLDDLRASALRHLLNALLPLEVFPLNSADFQTAVTSARERIPGLAMQLIDRVGQILKARQEVLRRCPPAPAAARNRVLSDLRQLGGPAPLPAADASSPVAMELGRLVPPDFLDRATAGQLEQFPRYLKALQIRAERAAHNPAKDQEKARLLAPYQAALDELRGKAGSDPEKREQVEGFRAMVEEYKISLFAQEMGTAFPVSPKRLEETLARARTALT
jgi:ATP-dependent helicase HrpA